MTMNATYFRLLLACFLLWPFVAAAVELQDDVKYHVRYVIDGDTIILDNDEHVRLVGINAPEVANEKHSGQPLGDAARDFLKKLIENKEVTLKINRATKRDRYGRWLADIYADNQWVQASILRSGFAHVYNFIDSRDNAAELIKAEKAAITSGNGIWGDKYHAIINADDIASIDNRFHVIRGTIKQVAKVKGDIYLNFGDDWKTDFTAFIPKESVDLFKSVHGDPKKLRGAEIITRGWVFSRNGPMIELAVPESLQTTKE